MQRRLLQIIWSVIARSFLKMIVGVSFKNREALRKENQFIILANHNSHLDTISVLCSIPSDKIHRVKPVAAGDYFGKNRLSSFFSTLFLNTLLIDRGKSKQTSESPIQQMIRELDNGNSLILFPEGTRGEPEKLQPFKRGIAVVLSKRPNVKYIPAFMTGMGKTLPKGEKILVPFNSTLIYGNPTSIKSMESKLIIKEIEEEILKLKN